MTDDKPTIGEKRKAPSKNETTPKVKKSRGRPKGSRNKVKEITAYVSRDQRLSARRAVAEKSTKEPHKKKQKAQES